jgi:predicted transposase YbfD/YdcC
LKGNHETLLEDTQGVFGSFSPGDSFESIEKSHGRIETRRCSVQYQVDLLDQHHEWHQLKALVRVESTRTIGDRKTSENRYYISSHKLPAEKLNGIERMHWGIENSLHWVLDVQFHEDGSRKRKDNAPENFAIVRRIALNLVKQEKSTRAGVQNKRLRAGWDNEYLLKTLSFL